MYDVDWNEALERLACLLDISGLRAQDQLAHMRYIEKTGGRARMKMLLKYAKRIMDWHLVPSEGHHPRFQLLVQSVQWGGFEVRLVQVGRPALSTMDDASFLPDAPMVG